jgi:hypothetical protein
MGSGGRRVGQRSGCREDWPHSLRSRRGRRIAHTSNMRSLPVHRFCRKRDKRLKVERVVIVVWPPFGRRRTRPGSHGEPGGASY